MSFQFDLQTRVNAIFTPNVSPNEWIVKWDQGEGPIKYYLEGPKNVVSSRFTISLFSAYLSGIEDMLNWCKK